jgi:hypothetical protein
MMLLIGRPPEAPCISLAGYSLHAHQAEGNYQLGGLQSAAHNFSPFKSDEQGNTWPTGWVFSLCQKKPPLGHLPWITGRGAGGLITFILRRDFGKVKKI